MFVKRLKATVKSIPFLYNKLLPLFNKKYKQARKQKRQMEINRFRRYCLYLSKVIPAPVFVKVGANDGIMNDPCSDILLENTNWLGLLIEPVPYCFDRLKKNFKDVGRFSFEQVAIGASTGEFTFYYVDQKAIAIDPNLSRFIEGIGSFNRNHIVKHMKGALEPFIIEAKVQVCLLSDVLMRNQINDIHLLHVDTEGHDYEVLKTLDFSKHTPLSIFIEHSHVPDAQKAEMLHLFHKYGYIVRDCGRDYFAVNKKANQRLQWMALSRFLT